MTRTQAKTRLLLVAQTCTEEAMLHPRGCLVRKTLTGASFQLAKLARNAGDPAGDVDPSVVESYLAEGIALVARIAATRIPEVSPWS